MTTNNQSQPELDQKRLEEITARRDEAARVCKEKGWMHSCSPSWSDVDYLLSLLQQPTTSEHCGKCGCERETSEEGHARMYCKEHGCRCVFPAIGTAIEGPSSTEYDAWLKTRPDIQVRFRTVDFTPGAGYEIWRNSWLRLREIIAATGASEEARREHRQCAGCGHFFDLRFDGVCAVLVPDEGSPPKIRQCEHQCVATPPAATAAEEPEWRDGHHWHTRVDAPSYYCDCQGEPCVAFNLNAAPTTGPAAPLDDDDDPELSRALRQISPDRLNRILAEELPNRRTSTTTTSEPAIEAAREIDAELEIHPPLSSRRLEKIAAIISKHMIRPEDKTRDRKSP